MSYLVLARKWRPLSFADLVGQEHVSRTLGNAITSGRIHHAFLFTGARGVGKTSAARILAKALNCEEGLTPTPCNCCSSCKEITSGQGVDVFEIDGASNTGVDDIRELRENIRYLPSRSRYKIFIIDEVHMLSLSAFNALLKTLEEPPSHAKFIFATTEPHKIPITILSRCQRFDFRKIALPQLLNRLQEITEAEKVRISERALTLVARRGEGSMRDSLSTLDQVIAFCGDDVADSDVQGLLGMVDRRLLQDAVEGVLRHDAALVLETVRRVDELGYALRQFNRQMVEQFRALVLLQVLKPENTAAYLDMTDDELSELRSLAELGSVEDAQRAITALLRNDAELATSPMPRLTLEMVLVRLAHLPPSREIAVLLRKLEGLEQRLTSAEGVASVPPPQTVREGRPSPVAAASEKKESAPPASQPEKEKGWAGLIDYVKQARRPALASLLTQASLLELELPHLVLGAARGSFTLGQLDDGDNRRDLEQLASTYFSTAVRLDVRGVAKEEGGVPPSLQEQQQRKESDRASRLKADALAHSSLKSVLEIFGGEVKDVRPIDKGYV
ncbi:MAG: DNA polymerase III subunit gamma/tau [Desulfuromonas sp.]|nr:MAG: DNA polymerase III subunit gamma/tau [Desulfuromonas sp.]